MQPAGKPAAAAQAWCLDPDEVGDRLASQDRDDRQRERDQHQRPRPALHRRQQRLADAEVTEHAPRALSRPASPARTRSGSAGSSPAPRANRSRRRGARTRSIETSAMTLLAIIAPARPDGLRGLGVAQLAQRSRYPVAAAGEPSCEQADPTRRPVRRRSSHDACDGSEPCGGAVLQFRLCRASFIPAALPRPRLSEPAWRPSSPPAMSC